MNHVKGIGAVRLRLLLDHFGDLETAWRASPVELLLAGLTEKIVDELVKVRSGIDLDRIEARLSSEHITVLTWEDESYPRHLLNIEQPPPVLYLRGSYLPEDEWAVAVVGTRRITPYGRQITEEISAFLAGNGITVVSGLARGVDATAHQAALRHHGRTIAVLGSGVDRIYPPENSKLAENIMANGALISDYPPGTDPLANNFPPRNRIISGLSLATVIVEAGKTSGALITARFAVEQGRDVLAVPGPIHAPHSLGTNELIQQGAHPLLQPKDILDVLDLHMITEHQAAQVMLPKDPLEARLINLLGTQPVHVDEIRAQANLPIETVTATLTMMELKGMVKQVGGMQYIAVREQALADQEKNYSVSEGE
jgi:DNA processing protein